MVTKTKKPKQKRDKSCNFHVCIHLRDFGGSADTSPRYCVEATCERHQGTWQALTDDIQTAAGLAHNFPLVHGGLVLSANEEALPISPDCILTKIPSQFGQQTG